VSLEQEVTQLIDSETLSSDIGWDLVAGTPPGPGELTQEFEALAAYCKALRSAIRRLAREIDELNTRKLE
jgi:hypothetical protein